jgi:N-acetylglutamate synthase-like GNAT family acetyltransferase
MIEIETFCERHQPGVVDVILPIQQSEFNIPISLDAQPDLLDIPGFYQQGGGNFWVALDGSEVVGTIALLDIGNAQGALRKMFVKAPFRGPERAVAHRLLRVLLNWCGCNHFQEIFLGTTAQFLAAHRFYEKSGFVEVQPAELPAAFPIMAVDTKFYKHCLDGGGA